MYPKQPQYWNISPQPSTASWLQHSTRQHQPSTLCTKENSRHDSVRDTEGRELMPSTQASIRPRVAVS